MRIVSHSFLSLLLLLFASNLSAQFAWIDPAEPDVRQPVTIFVDIAQDPDCSNLLDSEGPLYLWTWHPSNPTIENGNGEWNNSNDAMEMTYEGGTVWSFTYTPAEFYDVANFKDIYTEGIKFLVKENDGGGGGDCNDGESEFKTSDIELSIPSPFVLPVYTIPDIVADTAVFSRTDDVFSIVYDNKLEEKPALIGATDLFVYPRAFDTDGNQYLYTTLFNVEDDEALRMQDNGNSVYSFSFIPDELFSDVIPDGVEIQSIQLQILEAPFCGTTDCVVDGEYVYDFVCP